MFRSESTWSGRYEASIADREILSTVKTTSPQPTTKSKSVIAAFELYEQRGREHGHDLEDWLQAEAEVVAASYSQAYRFVAKAVTGYNI